MKKISPAFASLALMLFASSAFAAKYTADPSHSNVDFTIRHLVSNVRGSFDKFEGTFDFDGEKGEKLENVNFTVDATSINTGNKKRDEHLRSPDFFDAKKHPKITFVSKSTSKSGDKKFKMEGDLTMRGVTKTVLWDVDFNGVGPNMMGGKSAGFTAKANVNRKDFEINWNKTLDKGNVVLGDEVALVVNIEATEGSPADAKPTQKAQVKEQMKPSDTKKK